MEHATVIVIGGGATGVGILRDLSMRGIDTLLIEKQISLTGQVLVITACCTAVGAMPSKIRKQHVSVSRRTRFSARLAARA